jgi:hypothetical protein
MYTKFYLENPKGTALLKDTGIGDNIKWVLQKWAWTGFN